MNKKSLRDLCLLVVICLVAALALAITNQLTEGPIQQNIILAAEQTRIQMLPAAATFTEVELSEGSDMNSCFEGYDADNNLVGYVIQTTVNGYSGEVDVTMGLDAESKIVGVNVGGANFSETAGLGALAKEPAFTDQYIGKSAPITLVKVSDPKGDNTVDAISGATRTSAAVNGGINLAGKYIADLAGGGSLNTASANGFAGPVAVTIELDDASAISAITIGDEYFNETEGYGKAALDESFYGQFIGMTPPLELSDIDAISGATVTSTAVVNALNLAYGQLTGEEAPAADVTEDISAEEETTAQDIDAVLFDDGWRATAQGYAGPVTIMLALDENLKITAMQVGSTDFAETPGFGAKSLDDEFMNQFLDKTLPITLDDIDAIAGATITTNAVLSAIDGIYTAATDDVPDEPLPYSTAAFNELEEAILTEKPATEAVAVEPEVTATEVPVAVIDDPIVPNIATFGENGRWSAIAQGYEGPVAVKLTLDEANAITAIEIGDENFKETPTLGAKVLENEFKNQFIGKALPLADDDIDAITGATMTTIAVLEAIDLIYEAIDQSNDAIAATEVPAAMTEEPVVATEIPATEIPAATTDDPNAAAQAEESEWSATAQGFKSPVTVKLTLDDTNTITAIEIGDEQFAETDGLGTKVLEDEFKNQFVGKTLPLADDDIDAITGATVTTIAVLEAIDSIYEEMTADAVWSAAAQGFAGPVTVKLTLDGTNTITAIEIGDDQFVETADYGAKALEDKFKNQFIGKILPLADDDIDAISGATMTTTAVLNAINSIYDLAK